MTDREPHNTMTENTRRTTSRPTTERTDYRPELGDVSHTNPYTGTVFGDTQTYGRGRAVAADGGEASGVSRASSDQRSDGGEANSESRPSSEAPTSDGGERDAVNDAEADDSERDVDKETMEDVAHEPPGDADGAQAAYDRGAADE